MARGPSTPATPAPLPKVSFVKVQDDGSTKPAGVHDGQARSYGCASYMSEGVMHTDSSGPQTMVSQTSPGQNIILGILVCSCDHLCLDSIYHGDVTEPLESELAVQVEYDMDEQG